MPLACEDESQVEAAIIADIRSYLTFRCNESPKIAVLSSFFFVVVIVIIIIIIIMLFNISRCMEDRPIRNSTLVKIYRLLSLWELL